MAKWAGEIGFVVENEDDYGVVTTEEVVRHYTGNFNKNYRRLRDGINVNDTVVINNEISVIADPYMSNNFHTIRYATYMGTKWKVETADPQYPRIVLTLGGMYVNG